MVEARAITQTAAFEAAVRFARTEGIIPAPEPAHAIRAVIDEALAAKEAGEERVILFNLSATGTSTWPPTTPTSAGELEDLEFSEDDMTRRSSACPRRPRSPEIRRGSVSWIIEAPMISTVAVATDGSETAGEAVTQATEIARRFGAKLWLLSAFESSPRNDKNIELQWSSSSSAQVKSLLEKLEAETAAAGIECATQVDEGDPAEVIVRLATESRCRPPGNRQQGDAAARAGQRAEHRDSQAPCSVLVVKTT